MNRTDLNTLERKRKGVTTRKILLANFGLHMASREAILNEIDSKKDENAVAYIHIYTKDGENHQENVFALSIVLTLSILSQSEVHCPLITHSIRSRNTSLCNHYNEIFNPLLQTTNT